MRLGRKQIGVLCLSMLLPAGGCAPSVPVDILPDTLPNGVVATAYLQTLTAPLVDYPRWEISAGALPPGLTLGADDGAIRGFPGQAGTFDFTVAVLGTFRLPVAQASYTLTIWPYLSATGDPPAGRVGEVYAFQFGVTGGGKHEEADDEQQQDEAEAVCEPRRLLQEAPPVARGWGLFAGVCLIGHRQPSLYPTPGLPERVSIVV